MNSKIKLTYDKDGTQGKVAETSHTGQGIWILTITLPLAPFFLFFLGLHSWHTEVPSLGIEVERGTTQPQQCYIQAKSAAFTQSMTMLNP